MTLAYHRSAKNALLTTICSLALLALPATSSVAQTKTREVSIGLQAAITSMDPHYHNVGPNNSLVRHVFESLVHSDENQKLVPGLATSWK
ncbi:MAG: ABC transporter substrate-binding protein, partial [Rhodocyclaceae bacterium]|nr:ABC transporter substrate-binding protein [Rhodocyclaceae bacterium]